MRNIVVYFQIIVSLLLVTTIILQARGTGLGSLWGGGGESYRSKRGAEKILFIITIVLATLFLLSSVVSVLL